MQCWLGTFKSYALARAGKSSKSYSCINQGGQLGFKVQLDVPGCSSNSEDNMGDIPDSQNNDLVYMNWKKNL